MTAASSRRGDAFTLIELLVVMAIVAILIAVLLPAIGRARFNAKMLQHSTNIRGMTAAYMNYSTDQKGNLAQVVFSLGTDPFWFQVPGFFDHTQIFNDYGVMPLTASPVLGNARMDDPSVTFSERALPFYYFAIDPAKLLLPCTVPGFETVNCIAPIRLDQGRSDNVLLQDALTHNGGSDYWGNLPNDPARAASAYCYVPSMTCHKHIPFTSLDQILGSYTGCYDGSVRLRKTAEARWVGYYFLNSTTFTWAHFQPE